jgi:molecular chaperone DnaK (HSP70)
MRLGIDFGTTRIVVAAVDRGNYPVLGFEGPDGTVREWAPALVAAAPGGLCFGWQAWARQGEPGVTAVRSLKRVLAAAGPQSRVALGAGETPLSELLAGLASALRSDLIHHSSLDIPAGEALQIMLGVPANANSNQRFLTVEAFKEAGFEVLGLLNEPSAASIEYAHRHAGAASSETILVYDLGGGTFDVSLVERAGRQHSVLATEGIPTLGGDDFDEVLAGLALEAAGGLSHEGLSAAEEFLLAEECREKKEALHPNTRRIVVDLDRVREGLGPVSVPASVFYDLCRPLVDETLHAAADLLERTGAASVSLYVTGGGSELPLVGRLLRERFGRRVRRSAYTRAATAIGLAIHADAAAGYTLRERFTRHFGVWREAEAGRNVVFDPLFARDTLLPGPDEAPLERSRRYSPVHNIGHFRYLECSHRSADGQPTGEITAWDEIRFPFDPAFITSDLAQAPVALSPDAAHYLVEERYLADSSGGVRVEIANLTAGYRLSYRLGRWAPQQETITPQKAARQRNRRKTAG